MIIIVCGGNSSTES